jgi:hypothetical protein
MTDMTDARLTLRTLTLPEVAMLIEWAAGEGWNPGLHDAAAFHATDPDGFLGGFLGDEMVAGISAVAYGADFGFIGLYICRPDRRGKGYGKAVWDAGMARLAGRTVGLDGVPAQQRNYAKLGFAAAYRTFRYGGVPKIGVDAAVLPAAGATAGVRPITPDLFPAVAAFDRAHFPAPRDTFLCRWLDLPHVALAVTAGGSTVQGYGVARACRTGFKIGPLLARDQATATTLLSALAEASGDAVHIDVPETSSSFAALLERAGMTRGFETARMYRGPAPAVALDHIYGVTTLELG